MSNRKIRQSFLREVARFERCCGGPPPTPIGLEQFHAFESRGVRPDNPDPYFQRLCDGKAWWEWTVNQYASTYGTFEWPGWLQLQYEFAGDESGLRQIIQRVGAA